MSVSVSVNGAVEVAVVYQLLADFGEHPRHLSGARCIRRLSNSN
jgi:hypothetical protein